MIDEVLPGCGADDAPWRPPVATSSRRQVALALVCACIALLASGILRAYASTDKVALVIGNGAYVNVSKLPNPPKDAAAVGAALRGIGFEVIEAKDLDERAMRAALRSFEGKVQGSAVALVFYAGHGMEVDGVNYIIPVDAQLSRDTHIADEAVPLSRVQEAVAGASALRIVLLDACRDNPFAVRMERTNATRSIGRGLARIEPSAASIISYAAEAGTVAADGNGDHSPYTASFIRHIATPGLEVNFVFRRIGADVREATHGAQRPVIYASLGTEEIYLAGRPAQDGRHEPEKDYELALAINTTEAWDAFLHYNDSGYYADLARASRSRLREAKALTGDDRPPSAKAEAEMPLEEAYWRTIAASNVAGDFKSYIRRYPSGVFVDLAQARILALKRAGEVNAAVGVSLDGTASKELLRRNAMARMDRLPKTMIQYGLSALGFPLEATGVFDAASRRAAREYQASVNEVQTGELTPQQTVDLLLAAASAGDKEAQTAVGFMVASGVGLDVNYGAARLWFGKAAQQNQPYALANLAKIYKDGLGVERDPEKARQLVARATQSGLKDPETVMRSLGLQ